MDNTPEKDSSTSIRTYILMGCIALLLGSNLYLFFRHKSESKEIIIHDTFQQQALQQEIEHLEIQLKASKTVANKLEHMMDDERVFAENTIQRLKIKLAKNQLNGKELQQAKTEILKLRNFINKYQETVDSLQKTNSELNNRLVNSDKKIRNLHAQNSMMSKKIEDNQYFLVKNMEVKAYRLKSDRKKVTVSKAKTAEFFEIALNIAPSNLIDAKQYPIYLRIFDPLGNLITSESNVFTFNAQKLQYSLMTYIDFQQQENGTYVLDWENPNRFEKGEYAVLLYGMNHILYETKIRLR